MRLKNLISDFYKGALEKKFENIEVLSIDDDSRKVEPGSLFVVLKGNNLNGADFIDDAVSKGARVIVVDKNIELSKKNDVCYLCVDSPRDFLKKILLKFYGDPSKKVKTIGVTGTNGKTTITFLVSSILEANRFKTSVIGTIHYKIAGKILPSLNTTPGLVDNQKVLHQLKQDKIDYCVMEVSSHALDQGRTELIDFHSAIFTNLTSDHLDYHKTREEYFKAKSLLFTHLTPKANAIINVDDPYGKKLVKMTKANVITYGINSSCDFKAEEIKLSLSGTQFNLKFSDQTVEIKTKLFGLHNVYNILAAIACCHRDGLSFKNIQHGIEQLEYVPGRLERVDAGQKFNVFIDYAHTEDALVNVLETIRKSCSSKIILVFGCGGDRDKTKRPKMGAVASRLAHLSFVTSDNPRSEDPQAIIEEIIVGFKSKNYKVVINREEAIEEALKMANADDIVLIAGKGHETYQIFKDKTVPFNERQIVTNILTCLPSRKS